MLQATPAPAYGAVNVWDMYDVVYAREIPCGTAATFFYMLYSPSTNGLQMRSFSADAGYADFTLYGPVTDDANGEIQYDETNDQVTEKATGGGRVLTAAELDGVQKYAGFEVTTCLKSQYRLTVPDIEARFASEEARDGLIARMRELGLTGRPLEHTCSVFGLRRVR